MTPCIPFKYGNSVGIVCVGNKPVCIEHKGRHWYFEWHSYCGWMPCRKDGDGIDCRRVPKEVWGILIKEHQ